jgi:hypothetical protein
LKSYFTDGAFYGIDELTHVHVNASTTGAVINCFNLKDHPEARTIRFSPRDYGLDPTGLYQFSQGRVSGTGAVGDLYTIQVGIAAQGHTLIEVTQARS